MVRKKLVLNACGVKSLGGVKLFVEAFELLVESNNEIIVLIQKMSFTMTLKINLWKINMLSSFN